MIRLRQAIDTGGKDGTINQFLERHESPRVPGAGFRNLPPTRWRTISFGGFIRPPLPGKSDHINRSHYEDVLIVRVHDLVPKAVWSRRYDEINAFEKELAAAGTHILKFYLHISKKEQLRRFKARLDDPAKQWKISESDYKDRDFWGRLQDGI